MNRHTAFVALLSLIFASSAFAQRNQLDVGAAAPGLDIEEWIQGAPITEFQADVAYVVLFFTTNVEESGYAIGLLNEFEKIYGSDALRVLGVADEKAEDVRPFVRRAGNRMEFTVGVDRRQATKRAWYTAAKLKKMPGAFIVDHKGVIQFVGEPSDEKFPAILSRVVRGRYDARLNDQARGDILNARNMRRVRNYRMYHRHADNIIALDPKVFAEQILEKFHVYIVDMEDPDTAYAYARDLVATSEDPSMLAELAEKIATDPEIPDDQRDLELALEAADRAEEITVDRDKPNAYRVQALVNFQSGNIEKAIQLQQKAFFQVPQHRKEEFKRALDNYKNAANRRSQSG